MDVLNILLYLAMAAIVAGIFVGLSAIIVRYLPVFIGGPIFVKLLESELGNAAVICVIITIIATAIWLGKIVPNLNASGFSDIRGRIYGKRTLPELSLEEAMNISARQRDNEMLGKIKQYDADGRITGYSDPDL